MNSIHQKFSIELHTKKCEIREELFMTIKNKVNNMLERKENNI